MELFRSCSLLPKWFSCGLFNSVSFLSSYKAQWTVFLSVPDLTWAKWPLCKSTWLFCKSMKTIMQWRVCARYSNCACLEIWDSPKTLAIIGSYTTEMIPLILGNLATHPNSLQLGPIVQRWSPWSNDPESKLSRMQPHNHFGKAAGPNHQAFALYLWHTDAWVVWYWVWLYLGASWSKQCTGAHTKENILRQFGLISSVIWEVHFILFYFILSFY